MILLSKLLTEYFRRIRSQYYIFIVSIFGLAIALMSCFHLYYFVAKEYSVDTFHTKKNSIYRVLAVRDNINQKSPYSVMPLGAVLNESLPEVKDYARVKPTRKQLVTNGKIATFRLVDPSFFQLFDFKFKQGTIAHFKDTPNGVLLSEKVAMELFPNQNPIGKLLRITDNKEGENKKITALQIVGVLENIPLNSTIQGDYFVHIDMSNSLYETEVNNWRISSVELYLYCPKVKSINELEQKITTTYINKHNENNKYQLKVGSVLLQLQRFNTMYLDSNNIQDNKIKGSKFLVNSLLIVGLLVLILAITNYIVMGVGMNVSRVQEFKTKRFLGASKWTIFYQLCIESVLSVGICFVLALLTYPLIGRYMGQLLHFSYQLDYATDYGILLSFMGISLVTGILAGLFQFVLLYPAIFSETEDYRVLSFSTEKKVKMIICFQLFLFISVLCCSWFIQKQTLFLKDKKLGFDPSHVLSAGAFHHKEDDFLNAFQNKSYIKAISNGEHFFTTNSRLEEVKLIETDKVIDTELVLGDSNYVQVHQLEIIEGRNFTTKVTYRNFFDYDERLSLGIAEVIVNEAFVKKAHLEHPIGTLIDVYGKARIVGVFKNALNKPLYTSIQPMIITFDLWQYTASFQVLYHPEYKQRFKEDLMSFYNNYGIYDIEIIEQYIYEFNYDQIYKTELQLKRLLQMFSAIIFVIAVLGLIAISLFMTKRRTKEIAIRKINGASSFQIMVLMFKSMWVIFLIAFVGSVIVSYLVMQQWLQNFAFKIPLSWWVFVLSGLIVYWISVLSISWQAYQSASKNPADSLLDE